MLQKFGLIVHFDGHETPFEASNWPEAVIKVKRITRVPSINAHHMDKAKVTSARWNGKDIYRSRHVEAQKQTQRSVHENPRPQLLGRTQAPAFA